MLECASLFPSVYSRYIATLHTANNCQIPSQGSKQTEFQQLNIDTNYNNNSDAMVRGDTQLSTIKCVTILLEMISQINPKLWSWRRMPASVVGGSSSVLLQRRMNCLMSTSLRQASSYLLVLCSKEAGAGAAAVGGCGTRWAGNLHQHTVIIIVTSCDENNENT